MNYSRIYNQICETAKSQNRVKGSGIYYESHHIIPRCMGGEGFSYQWKTHPNIVLLTAREHFLCHLLLSEIYPENKAIIYALWNMTNGRNKLNQKADKYIPNARAYELVRKKHMEIVSQPRLNYRGYNHPNFGKKASLQTREKMSQSHIGKKRGHIEKLSGSNHPQAKTILKYSLDGQMIAEYPTITDAALSVSGHRKFIRLCCQNKKESYRGYAFKFKNS